MLRKADSFFVISQSQAGPFSFVCIVWPAATVDVAVPSPAARLTLLATMPTASAMPPVAHPYPAPPFLCRPPPSWWSAGRSKSPASTSASSADGADGGRGDSLSCAACWTTPIGPPPPCAWPSLPPLGTSIGRGRLARPLGEAGHGHCPPTTSQPRPLFLFCPGELTATSRPKSHR